MKRILAIFCAMACLFALAMPAMAANEITVTAYVPADWSFANVYVWNDAGNNGWPGKAMTQVEPGVFTVKIDTGFPNIIINNSDGTSGAQTTDLVMSGNEDVWVVFDGTNASIHPTDPGKKDFGSVTPPQDNPAPVLPDGDKVTVYTYIVPENVSPRLWAWQEGPTDVNAFAAWPGEAFTKSGDWWSIQMPAVCDSIVINGNDKQTTDTTVEAGKDIWAVVQYDWAVEIFYSEPDLSKIIKEEPPISENPLFSRPTAGNTQPKVTYNEDDAPTTPTTQADSMKKNNEKTNEDGLSKKTQAIIVIATAVVAIVAIAFVLSIPKKLK